MEVFLPEVFRHAAAGSSAYPPIRSEEYLPLAISFTYTSADDDELLLNVITSSAAQLHNAAAALGQDVEHVPVYGNYAIPPSFTAERVFGASLPQMRSVKKRFDPKDVMGLAGGWKV